MGVHADALTLTLTWMVFVSDRKTLVRVTIELHRSSPAHRQVSAFGTCISSFAVQRLLSCVLVSSSVASR